MRVIVDRPAGLIHLLDLQSRELLILSQSLLDLAHKPRADHVELEIDDMIELIAAGIESLTIVEGGQG